MRSQNINYNSAGTAGRISCFLLLLLAFLIINPISASVYAEGGTENTNDSDTAGEPVVTNGEDDAAGENSGVSAQATTPSTVEIAFSPTSASGSVTPVDATDGDIAKVDIQATVTVKNSGGYKIYVGSGSSQLKNGSNVIDSVTTATTYANMPVNHWGFSFRKANNATDKTAADSYVAMPATLRPIALDENAATSIPSDTRYYMLSFAARIGSDKPAGTYTNQVTMSVVSSPLVVTELIWDSITTMQQMTSKICADATGKPSKQLKDTRDGKYYWVSKLADGKCWMTQNLDLDLSTSKKLTTADSDVPAAGYTPAYDTVGTVTSSTIVDNDTSQRSWSLGNYRITNPDKSSDCGYPKNSAANCTAQFTAYNTPTSQNGDVNAHYILGNHYQWNAATAGTGADASSGQASGSICPKGWRLPTSNSGGEFETLVIKLGGTSNTDNITKAPFYGVRGGKVEPNVSWLFARAGDQGYYRSSTLKTSGSTGAYYLSFSGSSSIDTSSKTYGRSYGFSVRCVAR